MKRCTFAVQNTGRIIKGYSWYNNYFLKIYPAERFRNVSPLLSLRLLLCSAAAGFFIIFLQIFSYAEHSRKWQHATNTHNKRNTASIQPQQISCC